MKDWDETGRARGLPDAPENLIALGAARLAQLVAEGSISAEAVVQATLARVAARESDVQAWEHLDPEAALGRARELDADPQPRLLKGVPVGIKDIIDTCDMPTRLGSEICADRRPREDAACVLRLREAGAVIVGKTVTTEFAYFTPGKTRNPHDLRRTPGGSSSGSAAAVADRMVPIALATQAAGSTIRPASFCGIWAYKPTHGRWPNEGALLLYPTLDTLSVYGQTVADLVLVDAVLAGMPHRPLRSIEAPRIGVFTPPPAHWSLASEACRRALQVGAECLRAAGATVEPMPVPHGYEAALAASETVLGFEAARAIRFIPDSERSRISPVMREMLERGERVTEQQYVSALSLGKAASEASDEALGAFDAVLAPGATGEAPEGIMSTGDPIFIRIWNFLHKPAGNAPMFLGPSGMPLGMQFLCARHRDEDLLSAMGWIESRVKMPMAVFASE